MEEVPTRTGDRFMHLSVFSKLLLLDNFVWAAPGRVALVDHVAVISLLFSSLFHQNNVPPFRHSVFYSFHIYIPMIWGQEQQD